MIGRLLRGGFMTAIYAYLYIPIIILIVNSFNRSRFGINWQGFTTDWYSLLMNNDSLLQAAQHSLTMAVLSATFATLIGSLTAVALYRYRFRGKPFVSGMLFVVMMSPDIVMAISLLVLFMLLFWIPLDMPLKFPLSWMKGAQTIEATSVKQLADAGVRVGDTLRISGTGMCNIRTSGTWSAKTNSPFLPFD